MSYFHHMAAACPRVAVLAAFALGLVSGMAMFAYLHGGEGPANVVAKFEPPQPIALGRSPVTVTISLNEQANAAITKALSEQNGRVLLNLEGIEYEQNPGAGYEIYLNQPATAAQDRHSVHYAGVLHFYGLKEAAQASGKPAEVSFDVTSQVRQLSKTGQLSPHELKITFMQRGVQPPKGDEPSPPNSTPRIAALEIMVE